MNRPPPLTTPPQVRIADALRELAPYITAAEALNRETQREAEIHVPARVLLRVKGALRK